MRELTFKGYLLSELQTLSGVKSTSLYTFSHMAEKNARLKDALCLYLVLFTEEKLLNRLVNKYSYLKAPCSKLSELNQTNIGSYLHRDDLSEYETIYKNYLYIRNQKAHDDKIKEMMYLRITETIKLKNITNYRIYTTLSLNPGNANAFLKNGDVSKVSLDTTRRILQFVNEY